MPWLSLRVLGACPLQDDAYTHTGCPLYAPGLWLSLVQGALGLHNVICPGAMQYGQLRTEVQAICIGCAVMDGHAHPALQSKAIGCEPVLAEVQRRICGLASRGLVLFWQCLCWIQHLWQDREAKRVVLTDWSAVGFLLSPTSLSFSTPLEVRGITIVLVHVLQLPQSAPRSCHCRHCTERERVTSGSSASRLNVMLQQQ